VKAGTVRAAKEVPVPLGKIRFDWGGAEFFQTTTGPIAIVGTHQIVDIAPIIARCGLIQSRQLQRPLQQAAFDSGSILAHLEGTRSLQSTLINRRCPQLP